MKFVNLVWISTMIVALLSLPCTGSAEKENPTPAVPVSRTSIDAKIQQLQNKISAYTEIDNEKTAGEFGITLEQLKERTEILQEELIYLNQQLTALQKKESLVKEKKLLEEHVASGEALHIESPPPYPIAVFDTVFDRLEESIRKKESADLALSIAIKSLTKSRENAKETTRKVRQMREELSAEPDAEQIVLNWDLTVQLLREELAGEIVLYQEMAVDNDRQELALAVMRVDIDRQIVDRIRDHLIFTQDEYDRINSAIELREKELQEEADGLLKKLQKYELQYHNGQRQLEKASGEESTARLTAGIEAADAWRRAYRNKLENNEATQQL